MFVYAADKWYPADPEGKVKDLAIYPRRKSKAFEFDTFFLTHVRLWSLRAREQSVSTSPKLIYPSPQSGTLSAMVGKEIVILTTILNI